MPLFFFSLSTFTRPPLIQSQCGHFVYTWCLYNLKMEFMDNITNYAHCFFKNPYNIFTTIRKKKRKVVLKENFCFCRSMCRHCCIRWYSQVGISNMDSQIWWLQIHTVTSVSGSGDSASTSNHAIGVIIFWNGPILWNLEKIVLFLNIYFETHTLCSCKKLVRVYAQIIRKYPHSGISSRTSGSCGQSLAVQHCPGHCITSSVPGPHPPSASSIP